MRISINTIINPIYIILITYIFQFLIWIFFFQEAKDLYLVWKEMYFSLSAILKHIVFVIVFIFAIFFGKSFAKQISCNTIKYDIFNIKINWFIYILIFLFIIGELPILFLIVKHFSQFIEMAKIKSFTVFTYYFREHKLAISTLVNVFPLMTILIVFNKHFKNKKFWLLFIGVLIFIQSIFLTARILIIDYLLFIFLSYAIKYNIKLLIKKLFLFIVFLLLIIMLSEIFRSGILNSIHKNINLFSTENISFVVKYLLTAYIGSDVNNSLIFYDSDPNLDFMYGTSPFIHNIFDSVFHFEKPELIHPIERHGTMNFLSIFWIGWGYGTIVVTLLLGFFIGYSYFLGIKKRNSFWLVIYLILFPAILVSFRQNYFVQPFVLYPLFLFLLLNILINFCKSRRIM